MKECTKMGVMRQGKGKKKKAVRKKRTMAANAQVGQRRARSASQEKRDGKKAQAKNTHLGVVSDAGEADGVPDAVGDVEQARVDPLVAVEVLLDRDAACVSSASATGGTGTS